MKPTFFKIYFLCLIFVIFQKGIMAQERKSDLVFDLTFAHYNGTSKDFINPPEGVYTYPIDPGLEISYQYKLTQWMAVGSGVCYQRGRLPAYLNRFRFGEISIPLLLRLIMNPNSKNKVFLSTAIYEGKILHIVADNNGKGEIWNNIDLKYIDGYSESSFFTDLSFNAGISFLADHQNEFSISPMVKFRLKDNWMKNYRDNMFYGIKFSYQLNLQTP